MVDRLINIEDFAGNDLCFSVSEIETGYMIKKYISSSSTSVIIPNQVDGKPVTKIGRKCFFLHDELESVYIPYTVLEIEQEAFALCKNLSEITIPNSVRKIGPAAFRDNRSLQRIILPDSLEELSPSIFAHCRFGKNTEIKLPVSLKRIGSCAFFSNYGYGECVIDIPDSVQEIGKSAFYSGPKFRTRLPFDRAWVDTWPYGETITANGEAGTIINYKTVNAPTKFHVSELISVEVLFSNKIRKKYLYPISFRDSIRFTDTYWQNQADEEAAQIKDEDCSKILFLWNQGIL